MSMLFYLVQTLKQPYQHGIQSAEEESEDGNDEDADENDADDFSSQSNGYESAENQVLCNWKDF